MRVVIGTAGWTIPGKDAACFPPEGTGLERYARVFAGAEVNSSFHRSHRASTWERWARSVPDGFRFSVKIPKTITHQAKLVDTGPLVAQFAREVAPLGDKLAALLVQLPPKLGLDADVAERFFTDLRRSVEVPIVCEPRNATWFTPEADGLLTRIGVARAAANPALGGAAAIPGGWRGLAYWRLHGSPVMYRSSYGEEALAHYARQIRAAADGGADAWCIFDNTAASAATGNALSLMAQLGRFSLQPCSSIHLASASE